MLRIRGEVQESDPGRVGSVSAALVSRWSPLRSGVALALIGAALRVGAALLETGPTWLRSPLTATSLLGVIGAGLVAGVALALVRNAAMTLYLRFIWTRLNHHEASDLLDRLS